MAVLAALVLVAAAVRIIALPQAPPGLNQDEAANAWNAWCLLKTGKDQAGVRWPILYTRALGENRSTLYMYVLIPFQAVGGMNVWTTRLPAAVGGVMTVILLYWVVARLFDETTGLIAAALLALNPWHVFLSRLGHESSIGPLLTVLSVAALLWAGFPLRGADARPIWWRALPAGLVIGFSCYGYPATRLFLPPFLLACALATWRGWWHMVRTRRGMAAVAGLLVGVGLTLGPLVYEHVARPEVIALRAKNLWLCEADEPMLSRAGKVAARYGAHFGPGFLFVHGDRFEVQSVAGFGAYQWYTLPLMLVGLGVATWERRRSPAARVVLCWVLLYPAGDLLFNHGVLHPDGTMTPSLHALRSAPGLAGPIVLAALGAAAAGRFLWRIGRRTALGTLAVFVGLALALDGRFVMTVLGANNRRPIVYYGYQTDLVEACRWLRPRMGGVDAVFITAKGLNMPYIVALVALGYDPRQWFSDETEVRTFAGLEFEYYARVGKLRFLYDQAAGAGLRDIMDNGRDERVIFIVRPKETQLREPAYTVYGPDGRPTLLIFDLLL